MKMPDPDLCEYCNSHPWHFITDYYDYSNHKRKVARLCGPCQRELTELIDKWLQRDESK